MPFLPPQPEDVPCRGDRDPLIFRNWDVGVWTGMSWLRIERWRALVNEVSIEFGEFLD
jgi:hypothetical protein